MLSFREFGSGPPVVLVHGIPGSGASWLEVARCLASRHRVLVPDLRGFGAEGGRPPVTELRADSQAEALAALLDHLDVRAATVVGHDFGGPVALHLLALRPDLVGALALASTNAFADTAIPFPLSTVTWPAGGRAASRLLFCRPALRMLLRQMVGRPRVRLCARSYVGDAGQARAIRLIFTDALAHLADRYGPVEAALRSAAVPAAVMWGDHDPFFPLDHGRRTATTLGCELHVLDGAGHALPSERPEEVAAVIAALAAQRVRQR